MIKMRKHSFLTAGRTAMWKAWSNLMVSFRVSDLLHIEISALAATHVRAAETWWQLNRPALLI
jgi:hypothetical protein